jgi:hypothetical protein
MSSEYGCENSLTCGTKGIIKESIQGEDQIRFFPKAVCQ